MIEISKLIFQKEEKMLDDSSIGEQIMESIFGWTEECPNPDEMMAICKYCCFTIQTI